MAGNREDYAEMAKVINFLCEHYDTQPSLDKLAKIANLSPFHFQRKFTQWVGISPKSFLQAFTFKNVKELLNQGSTVEGSAIEAGLSSSSRLYDLCVNIEAATPGEIKAAGKGLEINYGYAFTPFGECFIACSKRGIVRISFIEGNKKEEAISGLKHDWPNAIFHQDDVIAVKLSNKIFLSKPTEGAKPLQAYVKGSQFQLKVWRALVEIKAGELKSYGELANELGQAKASRAVGSAVAKNSIAYLIPCHRVIRATGIVGEYRWGTGRKKLMIAYETLY